MKDGPKHANDGHVRERETVINPLDATGIWGYVDERSAEKEALIDSMPERVGISQVVEDVEFDVEPSAEMYLPEDL